MKDLKMPTLQYTGGLGNDPSGDKDHKVKHDCKAAVKKVHFGFPRHFGTHNYLTAMTTKPIFRKHDFHSVRNLSVFLLLFLFLNMKREHEVVY